MLCTSPLPLSSARALASRIQPSMRTRHFSVAYTCIRSSLPAQTKISSPLRYCSSILSKPATRSNVFHKLTIRRASTAASTHPTSPQPETLTWNRFLALRKTRRRISLVASIISALGTTTLGLYLLSMQDIDAFGSQLFGLDPVVVLGLSTIGCGIVGWLIGPFFGNALFGVWFRGIRTQIAEKERAFYSRIKKHRVDPASSSIQNPVPDFYGEKIGSVGDYRRWLKDQRAFNLKRGRNL